MSRWLAVLLALPSPQESGDFSRDVRPAGHNPISPPALEKIADWLKARLR